MFQAPKLITIILLSVAAIFLTGCAEGMLWRTGYLSPQVRRIWEQEEQIAATLFTRKQEMTDAVESALAAGATQQEDVAQKLNDVIFRDPIVLLRLHAVDLLGKLNTPKSVEALRSASQDRSTEIRIAVARSLGRLDRPEAIMVLQEMIGSDMNGDVRLAATQSIGNFSSVQSLEALSLAIDDKDPALQVAAIESLEKVTGQEFGTDVFAWKNYLRSQVPDVGERMANGPDGSESKIR